MKKVISCLLVTMLCHNCFAQWQLSLTLGNNELIAGISSPTDNVIWVVTTDFTIYSTTNGGSNWKKIVPTGLANDISLTQLFTVNTTTAFLGVNTNFTGVGPGIIYKTTDGGKNWTQVFKHKGNCDIKPPSIPSFSNSCPSALPSRTCRICMKKCTPPLLTAGILHANCYLPVY